MAEDSSVLTQDKPAASEPAQTEKGGKGAAIWREIRGLDTQACRELVWENPRFQSWGFFELLLDKARWTVLEDPRQAEEMMGHRGPAAAGDERPQDGSPGGFR